MQPNYIRKVFRPQCDITTYELACIFANVRLREFGCLASHGIDFTVEQWEALPEGEKRHFVDPERLKNAA